MSIVERFRAASHSATASAIEATLEREQVAAARRSRTPSKLTGVPTGCPFCDTAALPPSWPHSDWHHADDGFRDFSKPYDGPWAAPQEER